MNIVLKRAYLPYSRSDGYRILVDKLWPRGLSKEKAHINLWFKDLAPSSDLRKWYGHDEAKWNQFQKQYVRELRKNKDLLLDLADLIETKRKVTLVYSSKSPNNNAVVLLDQLRKLKNK